MAAEMIPEGEPAYCNLSESFTLLLVIRRRKHTFLTPRKPEGRERPDNAEAVLCIDGRDSALCRIRSMDGEL